MAKIYIYGERDRERCSLNLIISPYSISSSSDNIIILISRRAGKCFESVGTHNLLLLFLLVTKRTFAIRGQRSIYRSERGCGPPKRRISTPCTRDSQNPGREGEGLPLRVDYRGKGGMKGSCGWICIDVEEGSAPSREKT